MPWDSCPFRANFAATLSDLKTALDVDPGPEAFAAIAYYNPASGLGERPSRTTTGSCSEATS
jgi:hypothetical protein